MGEKLAVNGTLEEYKTSSHKMTCYISPTNNYLVLISRPDSISYKEIVKQFYGHIYINSMSANQGVDVSKLCSSPAIINKVKDFFGKYTSSITGI